MSFFSFFSKKKNRTSFAAVEKEQDDKDASVVLGAGFAATDSARASTEAAAKTFAKPEKYDRSVLDNDAAKRTAKENAFNAGVTVRDPYTGDVLVMTKAEAKMLYGKNWTRYSAESDHVVTLERRHYQTKDNPWLTTENVRESSNSSYNMDVVSRKFNNAKRGRSNKEFVTDDKYLAKTGVELSSDGKVKAMEREQQAQKTLNTRDFKDAAGNIIKTGHNAGKTAAVSAGTTGLTISSILNITAVIKGEKTAADAVADTIKDTGKAAASGYVMGSGLTTISHTLSGSSSKFIHALAESNVPGKVITAVMVTGDTLKKYANGEITTQECLVALGEKGVSAVTAQYSMVIGQALIPIPIVGAAVGALVGSVAASSYYNHLINTLKTKQMEHQERLRIIEECTRSVKETRAFRAELENYLNAYFQEYRDCFDEALSTIHIAFQAGDADGVIAGANQITRKLGGKVHYDNMGEFRTFLSDDSTDVL